VRTMLHQDDLRRVVGRVPKDIRELMKVRRLFIAGGFVRAVIAGEDPNDIDIFGSSVPDLENAASELGTGRQGHRITTTENAITMICPPRVPVQFITRWMYGSAHGLVSSFDFTICQAAIWRDHGAGDWQSMVSLDFYTDLSSRRLRYTAPVREEAPGGSMMRVLKYLRRGYHISPTSLGRVISRLTSGIDDTIRANEVAQRVAPELPVGPQTAEDVIVSRLREVDPLRVIDGVETEESDPDHEEAV
jgi:hypothetical protein